MTNFNERTNTRLYKNISLILYSRKSDVSCVWEVSWRQGRTVILTPSSSDHYSTFSSSWLGLLNRGSLRVQSPLVKYSLAHNMRQGKNSKLCRKKSDAPEESDLWTAWQLFPLDDDHTGHSKDSGNDTSRSPDIERNCGGVEARPCFSSSVLHVWLV